MLDGLKIIQKFQKTAPKTPGVYRMIGEKEEVLYVGKAKNLYNRLQNYTNLNKLSLRIQKMISQTKSLQIITTKTETEALLLEQDLIKKLHPKYNIMLVDSKSYPYLVITKEEIPRIYKFRGIKNSKGNYFGPYPAVSVVDESIKLIQNIFGLRTCKNTLMKNRTSPCLLYQIHRCSGICCNKITINKYQDNTQEAIKFLQGKTSSIINQLSEKMILASNNQQYEEATIYRNKISVINQIIKKNTFKTLTGATDIICIEEKENNFIIEFMSTDNGIVLSQYSFFPKYKCTITEEDLFIEFINKIYTSNKIPDLILTNINIKKQITEIQKQISEILQKNINIEIPEKGIKKEIIKRVKDNALLHLNSFLLESNQNKIYMTELVKLFNLSHIPQRIDVFDNSHIFGTDKVGAMIVAGIKGFRKQDYRKYNIKAKIAGDDYTMMNEVLTRRYTRAKQESTLPDLILVDGGLGQLEIANTIMEKLNLNIKVVGIAKGENRNAGEETLYQKGYPPIKLEKNNPLLFYLQRIRDEAHRFAITTHRKKRSNSHFRSELDDIEGIGNKKKKDLLNYFGSVKNIINSSISDLLKVNGINKKLAEKIYNTFHE